MPDGLSQVCDKSVRSVIWIVVCMIGAMSAIIASAALGGDPPGDDVASPPAAEPALFEMDFSDVPPGRPPRELLVLGGDFQVKETAEERYLELAGAPLDDFAVLFGPRAVDGLRVRARIYGESTRRRTPRFGVGLGGLGGYRLRVVPARGEIELVLQEQPVATAPFAWRTRTWTTLELEVEKTGGKEWTVRGRVWPSEEDRPAEWSITHRTGDPPLAGQASIWGTPYSGKAIGFDDLKVRAVKPEEAKTSEEEEIPAGREGGD